MKRKRITRQSKIDTYCIKRMLIEARRKKTAQALNSEFQGCEYVKTFTHDYEINTSKSVKNDIILKIHDISSSGEITIKSSSCNIF